MNDTIENQRPSLRKRLILFRDFFHSPSEVLPPESLRKTLEQLILIRVVVLSIIMGAAAWEGFALPSTLVQRKIIFLTIALTYAISLVNAVLLRRSSRLQQFAYGQLAIDVLLSSLAIYATSSLAMISFYMFVIVAAAFLLGRHGAVIVAALSGICYAGISSIERELAASTGDILVVYTSLVVIALVSSYIARRLEVAGATIALRERDLDEHTARERQLFDGLSEGVITLDLSSTITGINEAARAIMGLSKLGADHFVGKPLQQVFTAEAAGELQKALASSGPASTVSSELTVSRPNGTGEVHLSYSIAPLSDSEGRESGRLLRLLDVSQIRDIQDQLDLHERMAALLADTHASGSPGASAVAANFNMIGSSTAMQKVYQLIERVAASDASVLISGESGTGKELIARSIHARGPRVHRKFVAINCGAIPENLIESELFGHKKGSFTGAVSDKLGLFQEADGGTIFLDEIGELPLHLQTKLLRVLQERTIRPVGDVRDITVDVRIVAATNRDLRRETEQQRFREDLYYRLNVVNILVPPLRDRREDIPLLVKHFVESSVEEGEPLPQISPDALRILASYDFPGNIRELENLIERALVLGGSAILPVHLPDEIRLFSERKHLRPAPSAGLDEGHTEIRVLPVDLEQELAELEKEYLSKALEATGGIKKQAAELLGLNFRSFRYRLKKYGLQDNEGSESEF